MNLKSRIIRVYDTVHTDRHLGDYLWVAIGRPTSETSAIYFQRYKMFRGSYADKQLPKLLRGKSYTHRSKDFFFYNLSYTEYCLD